MENNTTNKEYIYKNYCKALYNYALKKVKTPEIAQDLVHDTFMSAMNKLETFRGESSIKSWLIAILNRKIYDLYRKKSTNNEIAFSYVSVANNTKEHCGFCERLTLFHDHNFETFDNSYTGKAIQKALDKLPVLWKKAFIMREIEELETEDICKELQISKNNLWVMIFRSKKILQKDLARKKLHELMIA
ncbi:MAG: RNA polymerase sigma factor [Bacteroidales bacterium]